MFGFSLIEFMIVVTLFLVTITALFPVSITFYNTHVMAQIHAGIQTALRNAHADAVTQKHDASHGVKILSSEYVAFVGDSYTTRNTNFDKEVDLPDSFSSIGFDEVVFTQYYGTPSATGTLHMQYAHATSVVTVYPSGFIE